MSDPKKLPPIEQLREGNPDNAGETNEQKGLPTMDALKKKPGPGDTSETTGVESASETPSTTDNSPVVAALAQPDFQDGIDPMAIAPTLSRPTPRGIGFQSPLEENFVRTENASRWQDIYTRNKGNLIPDLTLLVEDENDPNLLRTLQDRRVEAEAIADNEGITDGVLREDLVQYILQQHRADEVADIDSWPADKVASHYMHYRALTDKLQTRYAVLRNQKVHYPLKKVWQVHLIVIIT